jgi:hypothetical protein
VRAVTLSSLGACLLSDNGAVSCNTSAIITPPSGGTYKQIMVANDVLAALDDTGMPYFYGAVFPTGVYSEVTANGNIVGAVRSDGAAVVIHSTTSVRTGSYVHLALDNVNDACAIDRSGEISCWRTSGDAGVPFASLPTGPFMQIVGAYSAFCALRASGTTACWASAGIQVDVPAGW